MWEEYVGKKILVVPFDRTEEFGRFSPIEFIVIKIHEIRLNTLAFVLNDDFRFEWIYPSDYTVLREEVITDTKDAWNKYVGKRILARQVYDEGQFGDPREWVVIRTHDIHTMIIDTASRGDGNGRLVPTWKDTSEYEVLGVL